MTKPDQRAAEFSIPDTVSVTLKRPIKIKNADGDQTLDELTFRPPTVGEMKTIAKRQESQGEASAGILLLSLLSNDRLSPVDIEKLNFIDMQLCQEALAPFLALNEPSVAPKD